MNKPNAKETAKMLADIAWAFPFTLRLNTTVPEAIVHSPGMSLRDWFAGQALASVLEVGGILPAGGETVYDAIASDAYAMADAMLKAREAKP